MLLNLKLGLKDYIKSNPKPKSKPNLNFNPNPNHNVV